MEIKRIGVLSCGKILAAIYAGIGLIGGLFLFVFGLFGAAMGTLEQQMGGALFSGLFGIGAVVILPLLYGFFGFVGGAFTAVLYNLAAKLMGGFEIEIVQSSAAD